MAQKKVKKILALMAALTMSAGMAASFAGCSQTSGGGGSESKSEGSSAASSTESKADSSAASSAASSSTEKADSGYKIEVLKLQSEGDFGGPNPFRSMSRGPGYIKMQHVFDSLLEEGDEDYCPWLAESWSLSDDKLEYTFTLHKDATWHDGKPVTTADVAFSIDYYAKHPNTAGNGNLGAEDDYIVDKYTIKDDYTIVVKMKKALTTNTSNIGGIPIIPKHVWEKVDDPYEYDGDDQYIGCGMYKFVSYDSAAGTYQFEAYDKYYGHKAGAHYIDYAMVSDPILAFDNGDLSITNVTADLYDKYNARDDIAMIPESDEMGSSLMMNMEKVKEFQDVKVRQALYHALDRQKMVDSVYQGLGHVASAAYVPQTNPYYCDNVETYDYDVEAAKEVLEPLNLNLRLVVGEDFPGAATLAEIIKMNLEAAGVKVEMESYDVSTRDEMVAKGDYDLVLNYHGGWNSKPDSFLKTQYGMPAGTQSKWVPKGWENKELQKKINALFTEFDNDKLKEKLDEIQIDISKEVPIIHLITQVSYGMYHPDEYDCWQANFGTSMYANCRQSYTSDSKF